MAAAIILNIIFAAFVVVGMLSLLGRAIARDAQANGARAVPSTARRPARATEPRWRAALDPAIR